jgi:NAD(P)-dependent dehydrogenase (short-subunit alcohol dehydrogenase family)
MGMVHCVRTALPLLRNAQWARIVNFSAHSTQRQSIMLPAYTAAKAMVNSVSKNLSLLLARDEIMVNVVSPGSIASEALIGWAESVGVDGSDPYRLTEAIDGHFGLPAHLPRAGRPDEIAAVAAFLASRLSGVARRRSRGSARRIHSTRSCSTIGRSTTRWPRWSCTRCSPVIRS